jgi:hypothetical protein
LIASAGITRHVHGGYSSDKPEHDGKKNRGHEPGDEDQARAMMAQDDPALPRFLGGIGARA